MPQVPCSFKQARPAAGAVRKAPGASSEHAAATARALVTAEAEGNPGVGLRHVFGYRDALEAGRIRGAAEPAVEVVTEAVTGVDAAEGLPHLGVERAWECLVAGAEAQGLAQLALRNGYTCGALGSYARKPPEDHGIAALGTGR